MNQMQTKAKMILTEDGMSDREINALMPEIQKRFAAGAGTVENAITLALQAEEQRNRIGLNRHGSTSKRRGY